MFIGGGHYLEFCLLLFRFVMDAGKQQVKPIAEIQPAFRNLDIGQLVQGKTLTVGNLLDWQRTVIQAVESAKSGGAPISLIPVTTTFQPASVVKPFVPQKTAIQTGPAVGIATSVPVIRATSAERITIPENKSIGSVLSNSLTNQNVTGTVLNSMIHSVTSLIQPPGAKNEDPMANSPLSSQGLPLTTPKPLVMLKQPVGTSTSNQQVNNSYAGTTEVPVMSPETTTQNTSPAPPSKSMFKLSGRTLVTILPSGNGEGQNNSSHKVFGDDAFTPIDSYGAGAFEAGSPSSGDAKMNEKIVSPKGVSCNRARNPSTESNANKNNNNSTPSQSVNKVKQGNESEDSSGNTAGSSKKGKTSSRGRNIKNSTLYTETSDYEDDDVFLHSTHKQKSSKSKRSARQTTTASSLPNNDANESDQESMLFTPTILLTLSFLFPFVVVNDVLLYSIHMTNSG